MSLCQILLGATGSVASIKIPELIDQIIDDFASLGINVHINLVVTDNAAKFFDVQKLHSNSLVDIHIGDICDNYFELVLVDLANIFCIAPLDANTLSKIANGFADNLLTKIVKSWPRIDKKIILVPAMNTRMWEHPFTSKHLDIINQDIGTNCKVVFPIEKLLMCGVTGIGAMAEPSTISQYLVSEIISQT